MAGHPAETLQRAVFGALTGSSDLIALFESVRSGAGVQVYDRVPQPTQNELEAAYRKRVPFPYFTLGEDEFLDDDGGACARAWEVFVTVHVWSRAVGMPQAKAFMQAAEAALVTELDLGADFTCTDAQLNSVRYLKETDGLTTHGVLVVRYLIDS